VQRALEKFGLIEFSADAIVVTERGRNELQFIDSSIPH
jgi:hypothetical protein